MMRFLLTVLSMALLAACEPEATEPFADYQERAQAMAQQMLIVDTHVDVPYRLREKYDDVSDLTDSGDFDYPRARRGGLNAPFMSIYIPAKMERLGGARELADELIDMVETIATGARKKFAIAVSPDDVVRHFEQGLISLPLGMENGAPIAGDLDNLEHFYRRGIRYITLAHSESNHISDSSYDENRPWCGISPFGREVVAAMNDLGMMVDVSHLSDQAFYDVLEVTRAPVIASHSSVRAFTPDWERNMDDAMIEALAANGGVIQINFGSMFVDPRSHRSAQALSDARKSWLAEKGLEPDSPQRKNFDKKYRKREPFHFADISAVLDNIDHVVKLVGIEHVGIGSDFDGVGDSLPVGLKDVSAYPNLIAGLLARGYSEADIERILSGNILRVWRDVEHRASERPSHSLRAQTPVTTPTQ